MSDRSSQWRILLLWLAVPLALLPVAGCGISEKVYAELKEQYDKQTEQLQQVTAQALRDIDAAKEAAEQKLAAVKQDAEAKLHEARETAEQRVAAIRAAGEKELADLRNTVMLLTGQKQAIEDRNAALQKEVTGLAIKAEKAEKSTEEMQARLNKVMLERDNFAKKIDEHKKALDIIFERDKNNKK